jgi:uncharacterized RDD family membrane protein YckC
MSEESVVVDRRAKWILRVGAYALDLFIMSPLFALALVIMGYSEQDMTSRADIDALAERFSEDAGTLRNVFIGLLLAFFVYRLLSQFFFGRTIGKAATGIAVLAVDSSESPALDRLVIRELIVVFSLAIPVVGIFIFLGDGISMFTNSRGRAWHDRAAGTEVVAS